MYFDIVLVYATKHGNKRPAPQQETKNSTKETGREELSHSARSTRCTVRQASHRSPMLAPLCFFSFFLNNKHALYTGITSRGSPTLVTFAAITLLKQRLWHFCLWGTSWGAESSRWRGSGEVCYGYVHLLHPDYGLGWDGSETTRKPDEVLDINATPNLRNR